MKIEEAKIGDYLFLNDGYLNCYIKSIDKNKIYFHVINGAWDGIFYVDECTIFVDYTEEYFYCDNYKIQRCLSQKIEPEETIFDDIPF